MKLTWQDGFNFGMGLFFAALFGVPIFLFIMSIFVAIFLMLVN
jgi:hypothetical protein